MFFASVVIKIKIFHPCRTRVVRVALVPHSFLTRVARVALVSLLSGTGIVN